MPLIMTQTQHDWFSRMRGEWLQMMRPLDGFRPSELFQPLRLPPGDRLARCVLLRDREEILHRMPKGGRVAEVGTQEGRFAEKVLEICAPAELHLFDIDMGPLNARGDTGLMRRATLHEGDSSTLLSRFENDYFDWIYIDGDHSYEGVSRDSRVAQHKVKPGGFLVFNDFTLWSPIEFVDYGVPHVVCELSSDLGWDFVFFALHPLMYCDVALRRPDITQEPV